MPHALDQHHALRLEALVVLVELLDFREHPLGDMVLLERFQHLVVGLFQLVLLGGFADGRVEELLLDGGVDGKLADELVGDRLARVLLEAGEQLLDALVIFLQESKRVHLWTSWTQAGHGAFRRPAARASLPGGRGRWRSGRAACA